MKRKLVAAGAIMVLLISIVLGTNALLTHLIERTNVICKGQKFASAEEALQAMEMSARETNDTSLDYCPPYRLLYTFDYEENTIVFYSYCYSFDGKESPTYAVRILNHNDDGTLSFDSGFADFHLKEPDENHDYYTNIQTSRGSKSISFLYLDKDSDNTIYVDGIKAEKIPVSIEDRDFYICYAISRRDTFLSNLFTPIPNRRHTIVIQ